MVDAETFETAISIHALHEESDKQTTTREVKMMISIHALHEESDPAIRSEFVMFSTFQSTLSMRRATASSRWMKRTSDISIHALHEESDAHWKSSGRVSKDFNPRSP